MQELQSRYKASVEGIIISNMIPYKTLNDLTIREFANSDATKKGISEGGHFSAKDSETKYQALMRFLNEMDEYLDPTIAFKSLYHDDDYFLYKVIPELQNDKE